MAPGNGSDDDRRRQDQDRGKNSARADPISTQQDNPFVRFRNNVDNFAASVFTDITEAFPGIQKYVPPANKSFFDEWARDAFRRFNDRYERSTNPERKGIERMSCYDDGTKSQEGSHLKNMGRRWEDRRKDVSSSQDTHMATESSASAPRNTPGANMGDLLDLLGLPTSSNLTRWRPNREYLRESSYSPLQLEEEVALDNGRMPWREAFEDLLSTSHGLPLHHTYREDLKNQRSSKEAWIESLSRRRLVEPSRNGHFLLDILGIPYSDDDAKEQEVTRELSDDKSVKKGSVQRAAIEGIAKDAKDLETILRLMNEEERTEEEEEEEESSSWTRCPGLLVLAADEEQDDRGGKHEQSGIQDADKGEKYPSFSHSATTSSEDNQDTWENHFHIRNKAQGFVEGTLGADDKSTTFTNLDSNQKDVAPRKIDPLAFHHSRTGIDLAERNNTGPSRGSLDESTGVLVEFNTQTKRLPDGSTIENETHKTRLCDGSVVEYVRQNTRFPDGSESFEEVETVRDANGNVQDTRQYTQNSPPAYVDPRDVEQKQELNGRWEEQVKLVRKDKEDRSSILEAAKEHQKETEKKKGGWFWSK